MTQDHFNVSELLLYPAWPFSGTPIERAEAALGHAEKRRLGHTAGHSPLKIKANNTLGTFPSLGQPVEEH